MSGIPRAGQLRVIGCHGCGLVCEDTLDETGHADCPRCGAALHRRRPDSVARAWAFLVAALILGEQVTWASLLGGAVILLGVWLVNRE